MVTNNTGDSLLNFVIKVELSSVVAVILFNMHFNEFLVLILLVQITKEQVTVKKNNILLRKKRFLSFPKNSNFVVSIHLLLL